MMSGTSVLVSVITLMSVINHSYLFVIVELPSIHDTTFEGYMEKIIDATKKAIDKTSLTDEQFKMILKDTLLSEEQFKTTLQNYNEYTDIISKNNSYKRIDKELSDFTDEIKTLENLSSIPGCGDSLKATVEEYIKLREEYHKEKKQKTSSSITQPGETVIGDVEITYLKTLLPLTSSTGRIRSLLLNTLYGNSHNQTKATAKSLRSVWFYLLKKPDPMFGESYISYVIRMIHQKKMPLPIDLIPFFYGNGKLQLFDEFDIWPELNAVFVMYYLFQCPFKSSEPSSSQEKPIGGTEPIIKSSDDKIQKSQLSES